MIIFKMNVVKRVGFCLFEPGVNLSPLGITLICTALFFVQYGGVCGCVCAGGGVRSWVACYVTFWEIIPEFPFPKIICEGWG